MCAILDANVVSEVFGPNPSPAGSGFLNWVAKGKGRLVVGGKLLDELREHERGFLEWARQARLAGRMSTEDRSKIEAKAEELIAEGGYKSNDPHVLALALISGARLLYSNDNSLQRDFKSKTLIDNPRGKIYSTLKSKEFTSTRQKQLRQTVCS